jgi:hypothetical protein
MAAVFPVQLGFRRKRGGGGPGTAGSSGSRRNFDLLDVRRRLRNCLAVQSHALNVEFHRLTDQFPGFLKRCAGGDASGRSGTCALQPVAVGSKKTVYSFISALPVSV